MVKELKSILFWEILYKSVHYSFLTTLNKSVHQRKIQSAIMNNVAHALLQRGIMKIKFKFLF